MRRSYKQFDIVLVNFPFSDNPSETKLRPAIIVSNELSNSQDFDYIFCPITSSLRGDIFALKLERNDINTPLPSVCEIRCNKIMTIREHRINRKVSELKPYLQQILLEQIVSAIHAPNQQ